MLSISWIPEKKHQWRSDLPYIIKYAHQIHNIWQAYRNKTTYKGGRGTWDLRCFDTGSHFLVELSKITGHNYCSLLTSVPDPGNFGTDLEHQIRSQKNGYAYIQIQYLWTFDIQVIFLVVLKCKKLQKCILPCWKI
jgi:hypothetical protein